MPTSSSRSRKLLETRRSLFKFVQLFQGTLRLFERLGAGVVWQIAKQSAQREQAKQIAMAGEFAGNAQQILLQNSGLAVGDDQRGGFANFLNRAGVLAQAFKFRQKHTQDFCARRKVRAANRFNGLTKSQPVSKGRRRRESFGEQAKLHPPFCLRRVFQ